MARQILLPFGNFDRFDFESFIVGENTLLMQQLKRCISEPEQTHLYLWGESGTGKSHLLQAICTSLAEEDKKPAYIPLSQIEQLSPLMLEGLEQLDAVCIDDLDRIAGNKPWELALFHLFNRLREQNKLLIVTALTSPGGISVELPDLRSRLSWGVTYHLKALTEQAKVDLLQQRAQQRGFSIPAEVMEYLVKRIPRDTHSLILWLDKLDDISLVAKKKLTVPLVKTLF